MVAGAGLDLVSMGWACGRACDTLVQYATEWGGSCFLNGMSLLRLHWCFFRRWRDKRCAFACFGCAWGNLDGGVWQKRHVQTIIWALLIPNGRWWAFCPFLAYMDQLRPSLSFWRKGDLTWAELFSLYSNAKEVCWDVTLILLYFFIASYDFPLIDFYFYRF